MADHMLVHYSIIAINIVVINIIVPTTGAICQLHQKDLIIEGRLDFDFGLIILHQMDFVEDDGMFKRFNFEIGLVP